MRSLTAGTPEADQPGTRSTAAWVVIAMGVALALLMVFAVVVYPRLQDTADISYRVVAVQGRTEEHIDVVIEVDKAPLAAATCQVTAFTSGGAAAGRLTDVPVGPRTDGRRTSQVSVRVPTRRPATDAQVASCVITRPG